MTPMMRAGWILTPDAGRAVLQRRCQYLIAIAAALAPLALTLSTTAPNAALPVNPDLASPASFTGQLLVARPVLRDPNFQNSVIVIVHHDRNGALGIVINRPLQRVPIATLLDAFGIGAVDINGSVQVFAGGPVGRDAAFVLHTPDYRDGKTLDIDSRMALSIGPDVLHAIGIGKGPRKSLVAFGYAGWSAAQLDGEIAGGFWDAVPDDPALVFDDDRARVWQDARARTTDH